MSETGQSLENEPPSTPHLCMDIVRDYGKDLFSKVFAVKSILAAFDESAAYEDMQQSRLMLRSERISLCSISTIIRGALLQYVGRGQGLMTNSKKMETMNALLCQRPTELAGEPW